MGASLFIKFSDILGGATKPYPHCVLTLLVPKSYDFLLPNRSIIIDTNSDLFYPFVNISQK